ncbi:hypothetical protein [Variovorax sp. HW608]|uniref:hypothetical protein n=1 Tax=Variovorax sp. HW608 TaxID=1034889 RepID=UPI001E3CCA84|nr:hypothetical protein [Variovorax sp. HW608]
MPWFHIVTLLTQLDSAADRAWYAEQTVQQSWSRKRVLSVDEKAKTDPRQLCSCCCANSGAYRTPAPAASPSPYPL